jgi:NAD(P) transhydrogenase subunit beta
MQLSTNTFAAIYLVTTILFIFGLKGLSSPKTALKGNAFAMFGMALAVLITLLHPEVKNYSWVLYGLIGGGIIGSILALKIEMTSMPELVAILHSFVGLAATLVGLGTYLTHGAHEPDNWVLHTEIGLGAAIGAITFTGSIIAFGKLKGLVTSNPLVFPGQHLLNLLLGIATIGLVVEFCMHSSMNPLVILTCICLALGILLVLPIGGADMPVIVSMLNSYSGWAASATGFTLNNQLLIATGALVGSSGAILSYIMCKAMNRSFFSVILGGFGGENAAASTASAEGRQVKSASAEDVAFMMENSSKVVIIPGYGMAVSQAQHAVKELFEVLHKKGVEIKFAIHPVAGRMPGHMNVLLAEAEIPYDVVFEMEEINSEFSSCDVAFIIGANDIVNPAAKTDKSSPLYGMPILEAHKAKQVFISKRSMKAGYAGVDNDLFYYPNASLVFGDAKATVEKIVGSMQG